MDPTDVGDPDYYHRVVDCRWACPAHTDVPGYIRLVAQGRYDDAYLLNRLSNVFPGILGRTCDRPCEPACRRARLDGSAVAICRLKRVAADLRRNPCGPIPGPPDHENGMRVACVGAGPASLTVANDLLPLGYHVVIYERSGQVGGLMRTSIPRFRLPAEVLDQETGAILDMGAEVRYGTEVSSLRDLLGEGYDAVFIGSGAPHGKDLPLPGRDEVAEGKVHVGIEWLDSVAFGHVSAIGRRVLVIGAGNTAMDCCRTARRLGGEEVTVAARRPRRFFKASPWELEDAEEEGVAVVVNHSPRRLVVEDGELTGVEFDVLEWDGAATSSRVVGSTVLPCDDVILALGQENAFPWIERDLGLEFDAQGMPLVDRVTMESTLPGVFIGGDAAWGAKNIVSAVAHGHEAAISIHHHCQGIPLTDRPPPAVNLVSQKMGMGQWSYRNDYIPSSRQEMTDVVLPRRLSRLDVEVEQGFTAQQAVSEAHRCLNCDVQTVFRPSLCIECDACVDICPVRCLAIRPVDGEHGGLRSLVPWRPTDPGEPVFVSPPLPHTGRVMVKDEDLCAHCGLCAERCPTGAWDMERFDLRFVYAGGMHSGGQG